MATHFISDLHFDGDSDRYAVPHGFADSTEMTRRICEVWHSRVAKDDIVWILGGVGNPVHLASLPGTKHLVRAADDPMSWNCLATGRYASVSDFHRIKMANGTASLVNDPITAAKSDRFVIHGGAALGYRHSNTHFCVAAHQTGWGPVDLSWLARKGSPLQISLRHAA